jgi:5-methylthioadenosine/S-adenosylhomocysteine deaminase
MRTLIKVGTIVTNDARRTIIHNGGIIINDRIIESVLTPEEVQRLRDFAGEIVDARSLVAIPGFIQTHIHLCQTLFRGLADDLELLDWLRLKIFPLEAAHSDTSMRASALLGIAELVKSGTTTIMDMGSVHHEEEIIRAIEESGMRAFVGKAMMDINEHYGALRESTEDALRSSRSLAERYHGYASGRIRYAFAPRFVLSCSEKLLRSTNEMVQALKGTLFHTHAAENRSEMDAVRHRCKMDNIEYFHHINILHERTNLAHCIWLNPKEIDLLKERNAKVLHCPSSNLKLGSGIANIPLYLQKGITVSLGADGAPCNNNLDMFSEMRLAALMQKPLHGPTAMPALTVFELATIGGAKTLGLEKEIGSIEPGKKADIALLDLQKVWTPLFNSDIYSTIVYSCDPRNVDSVMVDGMWLVRQGELTSLDEHKIRLQAQHEVKHLLQRVEY